MNCIYCHHDKTYLLADTLRKCAKCKRKFSPKKVEKQRLILKSFIAGYSATKTAKELNMHFLTINKKFNSFRIQIALHSDKEYQNNAHLIKEYDEYLYLPKSLKVEENIDKLNQFLTLCYEDKVYNILMPSIQRYHYNDNTPSENRLLLKYLKFNKVAKLVKIDNTITKFWKFFEEFILQYKGVSDEQFIYYLKEAEWRFNYEGKERDIIFLRT